MKEKDIKHLEWLYDRMRYKNGEHSNYDYMIRFREILDALRQPTESQSVCRKECGSKQPTGGSDNTCLNCGSSVKQPALNTNIEEKVKSNLLARGFKNDALLNNRGLIGATIDETILELVKNLYMG